MVGSGISSIDNPGAACAFTKAFTKSIILCYAKLPELFTLTSRQTDAEYRMMMLKTMIVSAAITGFLILTLLLEAISSSPKDD